MNETVKAALLIERELAQKAVEYHARELKALERQLGEHRSEFFRQDERRMAVETHLKDNGVDLAVVDAEAERARPVVNLGGQHSLVGGLGQGIANLGSGYGQVASNDPRQFVAGIDRSNQYDATAGLAKALDEA